MTFTEVMRQLKEMGSAQHRKIYLRHGAQEPLFGVSFADLGKLKKTIKLDQQLADQLWATGNADAQVLATMIAEPAAMTPKRLDDWVKAANYYIIQDAFSKLAAATPHAVKLMEKWTKSKAEFVGMAGWNLLALLAMQERALADEFFLPYLATIASDIHARKNRTRHSMNNALIAIGMRTPLLEKRALEVAKQIGKVEVDHGETACKTPDAAAYIQKAKTHRVAKKPAKK